MRYGRRRLAARYLRALATLELLIVNGHYSEARRLLDGIDAEEARVLADELQHRTGADRDTGLLSLLSAPGMSRKVW